MRKASGESDRAKAVAAVQLQANEAALSRRNNAGAGASEADAAGADGAAQ